jgi:hypothetical protein
MKFCRNIVQIINMNNFSSNIFISSAKIFVKMWAEDDVCLCLGLNELKKHVAEKIRLQLTLLN